MRPYFEGETVNEVCDLSSKHLLGRNGQIRVGFNQVSMQMPMSQLPSSRDHADPDLLLLIPAYNEEERIGPVLVAYAKYFRAHYRGRFLILVVLNGCVDNTIAVVRHVAQDFPEIQHIDFKEPIGKGGALIEGLKSATKADLVGYVDADGATSPEAFLQLVRECRKADCVIGSRWLPGAVLHQAQATHRRIFSRLFHLLIQTLFWMGIKDTQCGAKVATRVSIETIQPMLTIADVAFDVNLLCSLKRAGFTVREVPTEWTDKLGSKVRLNRGALGILLSVVRLRLIYSPFRPVLNFLRPLEAWIYLTLHAPAPRPPPAPEAVNPLQSKSQAASAPGTPGSPEGPRHPSGHSQDGQPPPI